MTVLLARGTWNFMFLKVTLLIEQTHKIKWASIHLIACFFYKTLKKANSDSPSSSALANVMKKVCAIYKMPPNPKMSAAELIKNTKEIQITLLHNFI